MRNRWRDLSLGARLTTLSVGLLTALLGILGGVLYFNLRKFLYNSTALRMRAQAKPVIERHAVRIQNNDLENIAADLSHALTSRDTTALIFDRHGRLLANGKQLPEEPDAARPRPNELRRALKGEKEITYTDMSGNQRALVALIPLRSAPNADDIHGVVQLTTLLTQAHQILSRQRKVLGSGIVLTIALGILGEWWLTRSSLDPLRRVIQTIQRIARGDLRQRVQLPHSQDEVGRLASAVDQMAVNLESAFESQSRFVSSAAHELRTPLTALLGSLDVLQRGSQDDPDAMRSLLQGMHNEVMRLSRLTEQLLTLTRMEAPKALNLQKVNLAKFMDGVLQQTKYIVGNRTLRIQKGPEIEIEADPDLLMQVFLNLTDNAVQHTDSRGVIELGWAASSGSVVISVADNGEGISSEDLPHIFERFYRGDRSRSRRRGGTGLGLAIVQTIVRAHRGNIEVDSRPSQGTRFNISLPAHAP
jgi:two-component system OmpR family sensor kinase